MKQFTHKSIRLLFGLAFLMWLNQAVSAQIDTTRNDGQWLVYEPINPPALINGHFLNLETGELFLGEHSPRRNQIQELHITGSYVGVEGSKLYVSVVSNSNLPGTRGYLDIIGTATRRGLGTLIDLDYTNSAWGWDGSCIDLVRANTEGSDPGTFYFPASMAPMNNRIPVLRNRTYGNDMIWYIAEKLVDDTHINEEQSACLNDPYRSPELTVKLLTNPLNCNYQWYRCDADGANLVYLGSANGAQTPTYTPPVTEAGTGYYRCVVTSLTCVYNTDTTAVSGAIIVGMPVQILQHPVSQIVPKNNSVTEVTLSVVTSDPGGSTYDWYKNGMFIPHQTGADLTVEIPADGKVDSYYVIVKGCGTAMRSETATVGYCLDVIFQFRNYMLSVNNNAATNGGYTFTHYTWYKNGEQIWEGTPTPEQEGNYYYTGGANLDMNAEYWVVLRDTENQILTSCSYVPTVLVPNTDIKVYPTIVSSKNSEPVYVEIITEGNEFEDATIDIYNIWGWNLGTFKSNSRITSITLPNVAGLYILKYKSVSGVEKEEKVIVK